MKIYSWLLIFAAFITLASCNDDDDTVTIVYPLSMDIENLADLGDDYVYEGWIIIDGEPVSTGIFTVDSDGNTSVDGFDVSQDLLDQATKFVLTIEPAVDDDPAPSAIKLLSGDFSGGQAEVNVDEMVGDFSSISGGFILATPTSEVAGKDLQGIWFIDVPGPVAGLELPELNDGWVYEGWVVFDSPFSTGTFSEAEGADSGNPYSGPNDAPPFPGEDFLFDPTTGDELTETLAGKTVVISIEPDPDNSEAPFQLKPLATTVIDDPESGVFYELENQVSTFPSGTVGFAAPK